MSRTVASELAPTGTLRVGVNLANMLLVTGRTPSGDPVGVSPDIGRAIADRLGVGVAYVTFASPGEVADALTDNAWDIALIAAEPQRAETIAFTPAYAEIEATYLVPAASPIRAIGDVDRPGMRIAVSNRAAYDLYLTRHLAYAELRRAQGLAAAVDLFVGEELDALAGLRPALLDNARDLPGARVLDGRFTTVRQAIGSRPGNTAAVAFLRDFVAEITSGGFVQSLIDRHGVTGRLHVASGS